MEAMALSVWVSNLLMQTANLFGFACRSTEGDPKAYLANIYLYNTGQPVPEGFLPDVMWASDAADDRLTRLPHLFRANDFLVVSGDLAALLGRFDLGASKMHPVQLLHRDRTTPYAGAHHVLELREAKEAFEPTRSARWRPPRAEGQAHLGGMPGAPKDGDIAVNPAALQGADLWRDPRLLRSLFLSDRLRAAMHEAGMLGGVKTFRCEVMAVQ